MADLTTRAEIYSDIVGTKMQNPYTLKTGGFFNCYLAEGLSYDLVIRNDVGTLVESKHVEPAGEITPSDVAAMMDQETIVGDGATNKFHVVFPSPTVTIPAPPATGAFTLTSEDGVLAWTEVQS
jgi:hypothetical protein